MPRTCRRARRKSPICSDIRWVDDSNPEEDRIPSDRSARRTNRRSILSGEKRRRKKEKRDQEEKKERKKDKHRLYKVECRISTLSRSRWTSIVLRCIVLYVCFFSLTWQTLHFPGLVANVVRVWMLRGWYLARLLLPFRNVSKWRVEEIIYVTRKYCTSLASYVTLSI